jgi:hypothetical protein
MKMIQRLVAAGLLVSFTALVVVRIARYGAHESSPTTPAMPLPSGEEEERAIFLTPAGSYTAADIAVNGDAWPSQKYRGFRAVHDYQPKPGDRLCPITRTKANPACTWVIRGQTYEFCCPPCITEFVRKAKQQPDEIAPANSFIAQPD